MTLELVDAYESIRMARNDAFFILLFALALTCCNHCEVVLIGSKQQLPEALKVILHLAVMQTFRWRPGHVSISVAR